jgi:hypothetical protein
MDKMTTKLGNHCLVDNLRVNRLQVTDHMQLAHSGEIKLPSTGTNDHEHHLATNHSIVYFKYAFSIPITKFTTTSGSSKVTITFDSPHHFSATDTGVRMAFKGIPSATNLRGMAATDFAGKKDIDVWSNALSTFELQYDAGVNATSTGDIAASDMTGVVLIYKYLELAGGGAIWQVTFDSAPGALHQ